MPRPVTMPIANDKRRRPERTEAIRILKPAMSNIPKRVSATVAAHANDTVNELGKRDITAPVYPTKCAKFPQDTFFAPYGPHKPKRSATADRKEAPSANRANRRRISVPFSLSCAVFEFIRASTNLHLNLPFENIDNRMRIMPVDRVDGSWGVIDSNDFNLFTRCFRKLFRKERIHLRGMHCRGRSEGKDKYREDELLHVIPRFCAFGDVLR